MSMKQTIDIKVEMKWIKSETIVELLMDSETMATIFIQQTNTLEDNPILLYRFKSHAPCLSLQTAKDQAIADVKREMFDRVTTREAY